MRPAPHIRAPDKDVLIRRLKRLTKAVNVMPKTKRGLK